MSKKKVINGVIKFLRSDKKECVCCKGNHVYKRRIVVPKRKSKVFAGLINESVHDYIYEFISDEELENKKIKITLEIVDKENEK